jgi:hypothetical protein
VLKLIRQWLETGVMEDGTVGETLAGTPQGGVISPSELATARRPDPIQFVQVDVGQLDVGQPRRSSVSRVPENGMPAPR